jgi:hypothetical protein
MIKEIKTAIMTIANESHAGLVIDMFEKLNEVEAKLNENDLVGRISDIEIHFSAAISMLAALQNNFTGQCDPLNDEIMFYAIEGVRNELKACFKRLTEGTFYGEFEGSYPIVI